MSTASCRSAGSPPGDLDLITWPQDKPKCLKPFIAFLIVTEMFVKFVMHHHFTF